MLQRTLEDCEIILGNSNKRFSGVTSTMLQTLSFQEKEMNIRVLGDHHLPDQNISISFWSALKLCRKPVKKGRCRVFHARRNDEMIQALVLRMFSKKRLKIVFTSTAQRRHTAFTRWLIRRMDYLISTCSAAASYLERKPDTIIPHGIRTDIYFPAEKPSGNITVAMLGRVRKQKGVHIFVEACLELLPNHKNVSAIIVGAISSRDKEFVEHLRKKISKYHLEDRINFLGEQAFTKLPGLFRSAHVVVALSSNEGFGLTVLEAMSSGAAVIATQAGAWPEIIQDDIHGYIVPINNPQAVVHHMNLLISDPTKIAKMGQAGRSRVLENYKIEYEANRLCDVYRKLQSV